MRGAAAPGVTVRPSFGKRTDDLDSLLDGGRSSTEAGLLGGRSSAVMAKKGDLV